MDKNNTINDLSENVEILTSDMNDLNIKLNNDLDEDESGE